MGGLFPGSQLRDQHEDSSKRQLSVLASPQAWAGKPWAVGVVPAAMVLLAALQIRNKKVNPRAGTRSSLREEGRTIAVVTTAALPWLTGTSVNPLLRAAYLSRDENRTVLLVVPWLRLDDQATVFPQGITFESKTEQDQYMRDWLASRVSFTPRLTILFYDGHYDKAYGSVLPSGKGHVAGVIPSHLVDVAVLEEPEHLNWFNSGGLWTDTFPHVVGIAHTNYVEYARQDRGELNARFLKNINKLMVALHCHKVIKLSDAVQPLPKQVTCFVHGVGERFLEVGDLAARGGGGAFTKGAYFIGKAVWGKGFHELLDLAYHYDQHQPQKLHLDVFGSGPDLAAIKAKAERHELDARFCGAKDHLHSDLGAYRCFVNPSLSDVVATTTAEALAMGKWVVVAVHPENEFFSSFANCLQYKDPEEFIACMLRALAHQPAPLTQDERRRLTWEAATERFLDVSVLEQSDWPTWHARLRHHVVGALFQATLEGVKAFQFVLNSITARTKLTHLRRLRAQAP
mmetsp:Transcript_12635/g.23982  ORF Transcript_12635/g.23982 Transcript_12635/m.23982 type:complete len:514 (+) Transcript_12635:137-1678(+)